jgi:hypothetical protein
MGLRVYTVHLPPPSSDDPTPVLVKEGFSWGAFFFGVIWALWHRLWIEAAALLALFLAMGVIADFVDLTEPVESAIMLAIAVLVGFSGNDWRRESLRRRGYQDAGVVSGPDAESALRRFLDLRAVDAQRVPAASAGYQDPAALFPAPLPASVPGAPTTGGVAGSIAGWYASTYQPNPGEQRPYPGDQPSDNGYGHPDNGPQDHRPRR